MSDNIVGFGGLVDSHSCMYYGLYKNNTLDNFLDPSTFLNSCVDIHAFLALLCIRVEGLRS